MKNALNEETTDTNDRLNSDTYDANGNTTSANSNSYGYDFENRLTSLNNGAATFVYDGDGNRVSKTVGNVTTNYLVDTSFAPKVTVMGLLCASDVMKRHLPPRV